MQIPNNGVVLIADGRKSLFFRNQGDSDYLNLQVEAKEVQDNPPDREQGTDRPGSAFTAAGSPRTPGGIVQAANNRSAYSETDFHQLEEDRFAAEMAEMLKERALRGDYDSLVIVAPAKTLGELRKHYHKEVEKRLAGEVAKDLTNLPVPAIEAALQTA